MQNHQYYEIGSGCPALLSKDPETLLIFVHGFGGSPEKTWRDVVPSIACDARFAQCDVVLYRYDSIGASISKSAEGLIDFISEIYPSAEFEDPVSPRTYEKLILVAHSLGGVMVGRAIVIEERRVDSCRIPSDAVLRLVSPALGGVRLAGWKGAAREILGLRELVTLALSRSPSYKELLPESALLRDLSAHTERHAESKPGESRFRATIAWADLEEVVVEREYFMDTLAQRPPNTRHASIARLIPFILDFTLS